MNLKQLHRQLDQIAARLSRIRTLQLTAFAFVLAALLGFVLWAVWTGTETEWLSQHSVTVTVSLVLLVLVTGFMLRRHRPDRHSAARAVEQHFPELNHRLLAALEQQPSLANGRLTFLQNQVVSEALEHSRQNNWMNAVPTSRLASSALLQFAGVGLFVAAVSVLWLHPPVVAGIDRTSATPEIDAVSAPSTLDIEVEPGDVEIERGTDLLVLARFNRQLPADVSLKTTDAHDESLSVPLSKSLDDPVFGGRLTAVERNTSYHVDFDGRRTPDFRITVFDFPALEQLDAVIRFPKYTGLAETTLSDARRVSVVEGSQLRLVGRANKPIVSARLIDDGDAVIDFDFASTPSDEFELRFTPTKTQRFELILVDEAGRQNKFPEEIVIEITPNRRPDLKLVFPAKDLRVSPLEEVTLEATAWDDFGLQQHGLIYGLAGKEPTTRVVGESFAGREQREMSSLLSMETLKAQPDQLLSYYFFADDFGPDGKLRRTYSDMYFAEVRHFEEIFHQGQQPPGGASKQQGGGSPQSKKLEDLAKLQKQIVNATWKLIRRESSGPRISDSLTDDVQLIADSQQAALDQLHKLDEKLKNPKSKGLVKNVAEQMTTALDRLKEAATENDDSPLMAAMSAEQSAYQGLLKLRAREHKVSQSKGGGGGGGGSSRTQKQMNQLELSNKKNRYQTERTAAGKKSSPANREQLQVLNRLRDLARRQQGVNEKLKELENALREAQTEQEKDELHRRLKRLRDEQQEMLRDVDELRNRMDRPENQRKMAEDRRQLNQTREKIRQTSEALKEGQVSKALNSGTRTERDLKNLKEDFRKRTANQFADEMKDLRNDSRALSEKQQELSEKLQSLEKGRRTLRDSNKRKQIARGMEEQKRNLDRILDRAKEVVRKAEQTEPLLSRKLYDTVRKARDDRAGEHLRTAAELADKGLTKEAGEAQQRAEQGIDRVRQGIEQAAESVLGSETESLRTAKKDLDDVAKALKNELAQASPRKGTEAGSKPKQTAASEAGNPKSENRNLKSQTQQSSSSSKSNGRSPGKSSGGKSSSGKPSNSKSSSGQSSSAGKSSSGQSSSGQSSSGQSSGGESSSGKSSGKSASGRQRGLRGGKPQNGNQSKSSPSQPGKSSSSQGGMSVGPGSHGGEMKPLTGDDFRKWSDKLRDVEEIVEDPKLRDDVARVRDRARSMRVEFKRHSKEPNWDLVRETILQPLVELQQQLAEEIARRESPDSLVPIDREPVPERFSDLVEEYYKRLGQGKENNHGDSETRR